MAAHCGVSQGLSSVRRSIRRKGLLEAFIVSALGRMPAIGQSFVAGNNVEKLLVDRLLPNTVQLSVQSFQNLVDVLFCALHGCQATRVLTGEGFGARLKEQNKQVSTNESPERRRRPFYDFRERLRGPGHCSKLLLPGQI